jgi:hypothetical protein
MKKCQMSIKKVCVDIYIYICVCVCVCVCVLNYLLLSLNYIKNNNFTLIISFFCTAFVFTAI